MFTPFYSKLNSCSYAVYMTGVTGYVQKCTHKKLMRSAGHIF